MSISRKPGHYALSTRKALLRSTLITFRCPCCQKSERRRASEVSRDADVPGCCGRRMDLYRADREVVL